MVRSPLSSEREIGSDFDWSLNSLLVSKHLIGTGDSQINRLVDMYLASGRDALHWCIRGSKLVSGDLVLLPAYICEDVVNPFLEYGLDINFYKIKSDLTVDIEDLQKKLELKPKLLLYIHYFGFKSNVTETVFPLSNRSCLVLEDSSHSLLSQFHGGYLSGDIELASLRKLFPVPNGGVVYCRDDDVSKSMPTKTYSSVCSFASLYSRCAGGILKHLLGQKPGIYSKEFHRKLFAISEYLLDRYRKPSGISCISKNVLKSMNFQDIINIRRENYQYLERKLFDVTDVQILYEHLPDGVCPLGMPIITKDRDSLMDYLRENRVYAPIHWQLPNLIDKREFDEAWSLSEKILTIPIDQRYSAEDMDRISDLITLHSGILK